MLQLVKNFYGRILFYIFRIFPIDNKKIFFSSFSGRNCEGNPRYISEYLLKNRKDIKQVWASRKNSTFELDNKIKRVNWASPKMIYEMATAKVWIDSHNIPTWIQKRRNQIYIQVWHGGLGMKKIVNDFASKTKKYEKMIEHNSKNANVFISNSKHITDIYRNAFNYSGKIYEVGFPKNDIFYKSQETLEKIRNKVLNELNIPLEKRVVLYAPTFRENKDISVYNVDFNKLKKSLENKFNKDFAVVFRLHPDIRNLSEEFKKKSDSIIDASYYDNMQDLIIATDVFITDYSSGIFDFASLKRPGFLYTPDLEEYKKERGLYYELEDMPFPFAKTNEELQKVILNFNYEEYKIKLQNFFDKMGLKDNENSTKIVSEIIEKYIDNK